jgi:hypothetical protein
MIRKYVHFTHSIGAIMRHALSLTLILALGACSSQTYTTSGANYLAARPGPIDPEIAAIAAIDPSVQFPARIGIARMIDGQLTLPPTQEAALLQDFQSRAGQLGHFEMVSPAIQQSLPQGTQAAGQRSAQLTAARQHLDYVLIYDLTRRTDTNGGIGVGQAALMDVRTGVIIGTAQAETSVAGLGRTRTGWGRFALSDQGAAKVTAALLPEVAAMFNALTR